MNGLSLRSLRTSVISALISPEFNLTQRSQRYAENAELKLSHYPTLYLSDFFEQNRGAYYDALTAVRASNDIQHWIKFFLTGVSETAAGSKQTFEGIVELRQRCEERILQLGKRAPKGQALLRELYSQPIMGANDIAARLDITHQSASSLIRAFEGMGILREITGRKKDRLFAFADYLALFTSRISQRQTKTIKRKGLVE